MTQENDDATAKAVGRMQLACLEALQAISAVTKLDEKEGLRQIAHFLGMMCETLLSDAPNAMTAQFEKDGELYMTLNVARAGREPFPVGEDEQRAIRELAKAQLDLERALKGGDGGLDISQMLGFIDRHARLTPQLEGFMTRLAQIKTESEAASEAVGAEGHGAEEPDSESGSA